MGSLKGIHKSTQGSKSAPGHQDLGGQEELDLTWGLRFRLWALGVMGYPSRDL